MKRPSAARENVLVPSLVAGAVLGTSAIGYYAGQALAYLSLVFGVVFFAFAARYYVATVSVLLAPSANLVNGKNGKSNGNGNGNGNGTPMVSVHLALYNEERVVDRLLTACTSIDYPNYEVVVVDDSTDETASRLKEWILNQLKTDKGKLKVIHRENRQGFKGGALNEALKNTNPKAEYVLVFDADFVPEPDTIKKFLAYFNIHGEGGSGVIRYNGKLAAVQGYQWHTLNRSENWLTRGVSCEFSGNYMVDRTFQEVTGVLKMVAGSVYMIRADVLREHRWSSSITEDWELTLRLYENGYKIRYTPLIQAPAECPSTLSKLIRQRMRWAEGHTYNVKKHFFGIMLSPKVGIREKLEFLYYAPYYLQSLFLILGTFSWLTSDLLLGTKLPFWTAEVGWGLVFTNLLALPLMSLTGLFLEKRTRKDFRGIASQFLLIYALAPYQAYASLKGLLEPVEGGWVRTFKSGRLSGFPGKLEHRKVIKNVLPPRKRNQVPSTRVAAVAFFGFSALFAAAMVQGQFSASTASNPAYYFYNQSAPPGYAPFPGTPAGSSFLMHLQVPAGPDSHAVVGSLQGTGLVFFSDPAPKTSFLPFGASVSIHVWVNDSQLRLSNGTLGNLKFRVDIYNPANNTITHIPGAGETEVIALKHGVNFYQASWGHISNSATILKGETVMATIWCPDCASPPLLMYNSPTHPSNIDFPFEVPENLLPFATAALAVPALAGLVARRGGAAKDWLSDEEGGLRKVEGSLIVAAAVIFLSIPLIMTFNDLLASVASWTGFDRAVTTMVPYETTAVADLLRGFGLHAGSDPSSVWLASGFIPLTASVDWNCAGWQGFVLLGITSVLGIGEVRGWATKGIVLAAGVACIFAVNVIRIFLVVVVGYYFGYPAAMVFHNYGGPLMTLMFLFAFWSFVAGRGGVEMDARGQQRRA